MTFRLLHLLFSMLAASHPQSATATGEPPTSSPMSCALALRQSHVGWFQVSPQHTSYQIYFFAPRQLQLQNQHDGGFVVHCTIVGDGDPKPVSATSVGAVCLVGVSKSCSVRLAAVACSLYRFRFNEVWWPFISCPPCRNTRSMAWQSWICRCWGS